MHRSFALLVLILALAIPGVRQAAAAPPASSASESARRPRPSRDEPKRAQKKPATADKGKAASKGGAAKTATAPKTKAPKVPAASVGYPNEGRLEGGVRLDTARKDIRVVPVYAANDARWGLPSLVEMIERAAATVAKRFPGSVLDVGDLSRKGGGNVHRHNSHESGRDVDLGFYAVDARGKQVHARRFIRFDRTLRSTDVPGARFDVARNWLMVQAMLTDRRVHVSHIFVADPLRDALLAHAKKVGVSRALLVRAQLAMMQPTAAEPHDDHLHVRISCPRSMRGSCIELAKNAPTGRDRAREAKAKAKAPAAKAAAAKTKEPAAKGPAAKAKVPAAAKGTKGRRTKELASKGRGPAAPGLLGVSSQDAWDDPTSAARGLMAEPLDLIDRVLMGGPGLTQREMDAIEERRGARDDTGALKITD